MQVLERRLGVVDLVEVLLGRVAEPGQPEDRGGEHHEQQQARLAAQGAAPGLGFGGRRPCAGDERQGPPHGTAKELPPKRDSTA